MKVGERITAYAVDRSHIPRCLSTLDPLEKEGFSSAAQRALSGGIRTFPARLNLVRSDIITQQQTTMLRMSIAGMQDKVSLRLERGQLYPAECDGTHILKPIPSAAFHLAQDVPANEQVTMRIAHRLGIPTAAHGLVRLADGELAYITRRFDRLPDGSRLHQEDLGVLIGASEVTRGAHWKYTASYEEVGRSIAHHCSAQQLSLRDFLRRVVFCFVIGNSDAHVRNFSVLRDAGRFVQLSPAYDLLCTQVHLPQASDLALSVLAADQDARVSPAYRAPEHDCSGDFLALADRIGIPVAAAQAIVDTIGSPATRELIESSVRRSFLSPAAQDAYLSTVAGRYRQLAAGRPRPLEPHDDH